MTEAREAIAEANLKASKMDHFMRDYFDVDAFLTALSEAGWVVEQDWRPIETAPWGGPAVLLYRNGEQFTAARFRGEHGPGWCTPDGFQIFRPTHWRPLPTPPVKGGE